MKIYTQRQLLEKAIERTEGTYTDLARQLGVTRQAISQFKYGTPMSVELAVKFSKLLPDYSPEFIVACIQYHAAARLEQPEAVRVWEKIVRLVSKEAKAA